MWGIKECITYIRVYSCIVVAIELLDAKKIRKMSKQSATLFDSYFFKFVIYTITRCVVMLCA